MHELAIAESIVGRVRSLSAEHCLKVIEAVTVKIGVLQQLSHESLLFSLQALTRGTDLDGLDFKLEKVDAAIRCSACGKSSILAGYLLRCPACGCRDVAIVGGKELFIDSIEVPGGTDDESRAADDGGRD